MPYEIKFNRIYFKQNNGILTYRDIFILPFEGQEKNAPKENSVVKKPVNLVTTGKKADGLKPPPRKTFDQPTGKLFTNNIGIRETLNPTVRNNNKQSEAIETDQKEPFTFEELQYTWKAYCLNAKRNKKNNLHSALTYAGENLKISSDFAISVELKSNPQASKIEEDKLQLLGYLRSELKNYSITLSYSIAEQKKRSQVLDSKGIYDKMAEENSSLNKFRKLFNLDIEF